MLRNPFNLPAPASLQRTAGADVYEVSASGQPLGTAHAVDLPTGADAFGALLRVSRRPGEDDFAYLGRLQRLLIVAGRRGTSGVSGSIVRQVCAFLGRASITGPWDGVTGSPLDANTAFLDPLDPPQSETAGDDGIVLDRANGSSSASLLGAHLFLANGKLLRLGRDYLLTGPGSFVLRAPLARPLVIYSAQERAALGGRESLRSVGAQSLPASGHFATDVPGSPRLADSVSEFALPPGPLTGAGNPLSCGPFLRGRGVSASGLDRIAARLLFQPGGGRRTPRGNSLATSSAYTWAAPRSCGFQVGLDL